MLKWILSVITLIFTLGVGFIYPHTTAPLAFDQNEPSIILESNSTVDANACRKAIKLLTQYERLAESQHVKLSPSRIAELNRLREEGKIKSSDLPGSLQSEFPGQFAGMALEKIRKICGKQK